MNLPKFPHSAMFVGVTACSKTEFLLRLLETIYKNHLEFIVILCPTILDIGRSIIIQGNIKMGVNRLNPVQKATYF